MQGIEELEPAPPGVMDYQQLASLPFCFVPMGQAEASMGQPSGSASAFTSYAAASPQQTTVWQLATPTTSHLPPPMPVPPRDLHDSLQQQLGLQDDGGGKRRMRWSAALHTRFVEAVQQLGGALQATPKRILSLMAVPGLSLFHVKSHLQKYRNVLAEGSGAAARKRGASALQSDGEEAAGQGASRSGKRAVARHAPEPPPAASDLFANGLLLVPGWGCMTDLVALDAELAATLAPAGGPGPDVAADALERAPSSVRQLQHQLSALHPSASASSEPHARCRSCSSGAAAASEGGGDSGAPGGASADVMLESALHVQLEMQRQLSSTIESQRKLQVQLEAHGKYIAELLRSDEAASRPPRAAAKTAASSRHAGSSAARPRPSHCTRQADHAGAASACGASGDAGLAAMDRSRSAPDAGVLRSASPFRGAQAAAAWQIPASPQQGSPEQAVPRAASPSPPGMGRAPSMPLPECGAASVHSAHGVPVGACGHPRLQQHLEQHLQQRQHLQQQLQAHLREQQRLRELLPPLVHQRQPAAWLQPGKDARQAAAAALAREAEAQLLLAQVLDGPFAQQPVAVEQPPQAQQQPARLGGSPPLYSSRSSDSTAAAATALQGVPPSLLPPGIQLGRVSCATSNSDAAPEQGDSWAAAAHAPAPPPGLSQWQQQAAAHTAAAPHALDAADDALLRGDAWDSLLTDSAALNRLLCGQDISGFLD